MNDELCEIKIILLNILLYFFSPQVTYQHQDSLGQCHHPHNRLAPRRHNQDQQELPSMKEHPLHQATPEHHRPQEPQTTIDSRPVLLSP